jgi:hypothetical protein
MKNVGKAIIAGARKTWCGAAVAITGQPVRTAIWAAAAVGASIASGYDATTLPVVGEMAARAGLESAIVAAGAGVAARSVVGGTVQGVKGFCRGLQGQDTSYPGYKNKAP